MNESEAIDAAHKLVAWFESQKIAPLASVQVMAHALFAVGTIMAGGDSLEQAPPNVQQELINESFKAIGTIINDVWQGKPYRMKGH